MNIGFNLSYLWTFLHPITYTSYGTNKDSTESKKEKENAKIFISYR